jgi:hypothetical protein
MTEAPAPAKIDHWIDSEKNRKKFWARATELGYTENEARQALGVQHVHDFAGTIIEAIARLEREAVKASAPGFPPEDETYKPEPPTQQEPDDDARLFKLACLLPEAPAWASTKFVDASNFTWTITLRAELPDDAAILALKSLRQQIDTFDQGAKHYKWLPANGYGYSAPVSATAPSGGKSAPPVPPAPAQSGGNGAPAEGEIKSGVADLHTIKIDADGRVEFHCSGFRWPFKDTRGGEVVASLFDSELNWKPEHFAPGQKYDGLSLKAHWEKPGKYYDVVRVTG